MGFSQDGGWFILNRASRLFSSRRKILVWIIFTVACVSLLLPNGAVSSALLALEKGKTICVVPGCMNHVVTFVQYKHEYDKAIIFGTGIEQVGYCGDHSRSPDPKIMESHLRGAIHVRDGAPRVRVLHLRIHQAFSSRTSFDGYAEQAAFAVLPLDPPYGNWADRSVLVVCKVHVREGITRSQQRTAAKSALGG